MCSIQCDAWQQHLDSEETPSLKMFYTGGSKHIGDEQNHLLTNCVYFGGGGGGGGGV